MPLRRRGGGAAATPGGGSGLTAEQVRDTVAAFVREGNNITIVHDDAANTLTISSTGGTGGGLTTEQVRDTVAAFVRAAPGSGLSYTHNDTGNTLTLAFTLPAASVTPAMLDAGDDAKKAAMRTRIGAVSEDDIPESLMELLHDDLSSAVSLEQRIGDFTLLNDGNVVYLITVGTVTEFFAGDDISALREADAHTLDGVTIYSNASRHLLIKQPNNSSREVKVWLVDDVEAFAMIAARFLPTVTQEEAEAAIDASTATQRRIFTVQRIIQAIRANRDGDAFIGASEENGEITLTRRSGTDPVDLPITGAGGAFELKQIGSRATVEAANNYGASGITIAALDDDEAIYLRIWSPDEGEPPNYFVMRGATFNGLTERTAGQAPSGTYYERILPGGAGVIEIGKTSAGELLAANTDGSYTGSDILIEAYEVTVGQGGSLGFIPLGSASYNVVGESPPPYVSEEASSTPIDLSEVDLENDLLAVSIGFSQYSTQPHTFLASSIYERNAGDAVEFNEAGIPTIRITPLSRSSGGLDFYFGIDDDQHLTVSMLRASYFSGAFGLTLWRFGRATAVAPNPPGTDGQTLNRLTVQGRNYNLPRGGYLYYTRPALTIPADVTTAGTFTTSGRTYTLLNTVIPGRIYPAIDFTSEWFGNLEIDGDGNGGSGNNARQLEFTLKTTHTFNGKSIFHSRVESISIPRAFTASFTMGKMSAISQIRLGSFTDEDNTIITITEADLTSPVTIRFDLTIKGLQAGGGSATLSYTQIRFSHIQYRAYQIDHGEGSMVMPSTHNRYIGWSAAQNPTAAEFGAFSTDTDDMLPVPTLPAQFSTAGGAYLVFAVPKSAGTPTGVYFTGESLNQIGAYTRVNDWTPSGESPHYVYATNSAQSATALDGLSIRIEYGG